MKTLNQIISIDLRGYECNILASMLQIALDDMSDWATYEYLDKCRYVRDRIQTQLFAAGAGVSDETNIAEFK